MPKLPKVIYRKLGKERAWGQYWPCKEIIEVDSRATGKLALDTLIHESLHHLFPDHDESAIQKRATMLAAILWKQNYRRVDQATQ